MSGNRTPAQQAYSIDMALELAVQLHEELSRVLSLDRNCITCDLFDEAVPHCIHYKVLPPPRIIARGCETWTRKLPF